MGTSRPDEEFADALRYAEEEARGYGLPRIGTEHLLFGVLRQNQSVVTQLLASRGFSLQRVRNQYEPLLREALIRAPAPVPMMDTEEQFTPKAARVLAAVGTERNLTHLVGAILAERGVAYGLLESCSMTDLSEVEEEISRL